MSARRRVGAALLGAVALGALLAAVTDAHAQQEERLRLVLARAETLLRAGDEAGALLALDRSLERVDVSEVDPDGPAHPLLRRVLILRVRTAWSLGERSGLDDQLDRLVELDPTYELRGDDVEEDLANRFQRRRERKVGYLRIATSPQDAVVLLDGRALAERLEIMPLLEGDHVVEARRPGFAPRREEVSIRANRTEGVGLTLERASVTVRLATRPPGAQVFLDGESIGVTQASDDGAEASEPVTVEGLLPGWHEIDVRLENHRPFNQRIELPDLRDYDLGTVEMVRSLGYVVLRGVPADATLRVDGVERAGERREGVGGTEMARFELTVGAHAFQVAVGASAVFETTVTVDDGATRTVDVDLRPGVALLGARGGDDLDRDEVLGQIANGIGRLGSWHVIDRRDDGRVLLGPFDGTPEPAARADLAARIPASVYVAVEILRAPERAVELLVWNATSPLPVARTRLPRGDMDALDRWLQAFATPLPEGRAWLGAIVSDDIELAGARVAAVSEAGPAAAAGLRVGDRLLTLDGRAVAGAADVHAAVESRTPFASLAVQYQRAETPAATRISLGASPTVARELVGARAVVAWARAAADLERSSGALPPWVLQLQQAHLLIAAERHGAAVRLLGEIVAPEGAPFGRGAVDYWTGVALLAEGRDLESARVYLERAGREADARLGYNDGPRLAPRARARIAALNGSR